MQLILQLLGLPQILLDDQPIVTDRRKAIALLAYLAVNDIGQPHQKYSRGALSALFWPDYEQAKAFSNLRRTIWEVHQAIGANWVLADREFVRLNPDAEIDLDVARFQDFITRSNQSSDRAHRIPLLTNAAALYRNHFLTGFSLKDAYPFNEWAYAESDELRSKLADALATLSKDYCTLRQAEEAIPHARRLISLDPLNESFHRQLMEIYIQAGQHSAAMKQYQTCEQTLRKELNLDPQPETRALYKKIRKGEIKPARVERQFEPIKPKHNLPLQLSSFIGREKEIEDIANLLARNRLVTLAGVGGIGKTRLSLQVGQRLLNDYLDGVWFIPLDSLSDPALVPQTVASVFEIREAPNRPILEILINVLREKTGLLIFDNCEHLLDACTQLITTLLTNCPNLKVLTTSREILNMEGEATYYLPSLSMPEDHDSLEKLTEYESIQLFIERAALALSSFRLTKENAQTIMEICHRVDGIPLAIELAAAHMNVLQVKEILKQLNESFSLLVSDSRSILPRHQAMRASMEWSWGLLTESEQSFLRKLSVFAGGWTLESAQAVREGNTLNSISTLVKKSLIIVDQKSESETRYHFHEIVRQYMREKLIESGEEEITRTRHLQYFLQLSEHAEPGLRGPSQVEWMSHLNDERDNIRAVVQWADQTDAEAGLYMLGRLVRYWEGSNVREGIHWLEMFLHRSESKDFPLARAVALCAYGWLSIWRLQLTQARSAAQESLQLFRACGNQPGEVDALLLIGCTLSPASAMELYQQALSIAESISDPWRQANVLFWWGWDHRDWQRAFARWEQALILYREVSDWNFLRRILGVIGFFRVLNGDVELAQNYLNEATRLWQFHRATDVLDEYKSTKILIALVQGDYEQARTLIKEGLIRADELGNRLGYVWGRTRLGYVALREGYLNEARNLFAETTREFLNDNDEGGIVFTLEGMAGLFLVVGKLEIAAHLIGWSDALREKMGDPRPPLEQADVDKIIAACIIKMGEIAFSDAYDEGQKMTLDEAVAFALQED